MSASQRLHVTAKPEVHNVAARGPREPRPQLTGAGNRAMLGRLVSEIYVDRVTNGQVPLEGRIPSTPDLLTPGVSAS